MSEYYSYVHARPDGSIFYVGKGKGGRMNDLKSNRNKWHRSVVEKYGKENILKGRLFCSSEKIAFELEIGMIKCLRRSGTVLVNCTDGGEGASGMKVGEETRAKLSCSHKAAWSGEQGEKRKERLKKRNSEFWNDEAKKVVSERTKALNDDPEFARRRIESLKRFWSNEKNIEAQKKKNKEAWEDEERRARLSKRNTGRRWMTNGSESKFVCNEEASTLISSGWRFGRAKFK